MPALHSFCSGRSPARRPANASPRRLRTGPARSALRMAAALGYLDVEQQRRVRNALVTAINPDADLFAGFRPSAPEACSAGADR